MRENQGGTAAESSGISATEQVPVSTYVGSSKNLKDLKAAAGAAGNSDVVGPRAAESAEMRGRYDLAESVIRIVSDPFSRN